MNAGPWIAVPPADYGGIENVIATLVDELRRAGHQVVLATVGASTAAADDVVCAFDEGQLPRLAGPYGDVVGIAHAHMQAVVDRVLADPTIDVVHDHLEVVGPATLACLPPGTPPVLQTLHWDLAKHERFYGSFDGRGRIAFAAVSDSQLAAAPGQPAPPDARRRAAGGPGRSPPARASRRAPAHPRAADRAQGLRRRRTACAGATGTAW